MHTKTMNITISHRGPVNRIRHQMGLIESRLQFTLRYLVQLYRSAVELISFR